MFNETFNLSTTTNKEDLFSWLGLAGENPWMAFSDVGRGHHFVAIGAVGQPAAGRVEVAKLVRDHFGTDPNDRFPRVVCAQNFSRSHVEPANFAAAVSAGAGSVAFVPAVTIRLDPNRVMINLRALSAEGIQSWRQKVDDWTTRSGPQARNLDRHRKAARMDSRNPILSAGRHVPPQVEYEQRVRAALQAIDDGTLRKVVLGKMVAMALPASCDVAGTLTGLRARHPDAMVYGFGLGSTGIVGASPETLVHVNDGRLTTHAVAGTATTPIPLGEIKEQLEHQLVVEGIQRQLRRCASDVHIGPKPELLKAGHLYHLVTPITARLNAGATIFDVVHALHPTPALGGWPRDPAWAHVDRVEGNRGWFGAPLGWVDGAGNGTFCVAIRGIHVNNDRARAFAGAGIVHGSVPQAEWAETQDKLSSVLASIRVETS